MSTIPLRAAPDGEDELLQAAAARVCPPLSPMERAVLLAAARGAEDKQIAAQLSCSISTVRTLWQRIYQKSGRHSRRKLVAALWSEALRGLGAVVV
ncbi:helix-turn-helix transcriptional regulator [Lysobacter sp. K5869]|uniref:helix-turn-helix domain-containing protein n=1 Tax=Lysobacter sp. K5869 TaxID=2820808 RepID=UPI001C05F048|nr:helix-turn-helix transcriptional regulator [Lysobacter sp. K5869]QWP75745.1 helix-turn-helix transcriptional regulator [Lysobacter sp. K5869]